MGWLVCEDGASNRPTPTSLTNRCIWADNAFGYDLRGAASALPNAEHREDNLRASASGYRSRRRTRHGWAARSPACAANRDRPGVVDADRSFAAMVDRRQAHLRHQTANTAADFMATPPQVPHHLATVVPGYVEERRINHPHQRQRVLGLRDRRIITG